MKHLSYWERLGYLNLHSLERQRERYTFIYVRKMISGILFLTSESQNIKDIVDRVKYYISHKSKTRKNIYAGVCVGVCIDGRLP